MKTDTKNPTTVLSKWMRFLGVPHLAGLMVALMVPVVAFSNATVPTLNLPINVAHPCVSTTPTLSWNAATGSGTIHYELQVSLNSDCSSPVYDVSTLTGLSQMVPASGFLTNATVYYWRVQATDGNGPSGYTGIWSFTTSPTAVNLGSTAHFAILAQAGISTTGVTAIPVGDIGVSPAAASYITGFGLTLDASGTYSTSSLVTGKVYAADYRTPTPSNMTAAVGDMSIAYNDAAGRSPTDYTEL